jgi:hypothetical protein
MHKPLRQWILLQRWSSKLHKMRRRKVLVSQGFVFVLNVRLRVLQQLCKPEQRVHNKVPSWVLLRRWSRHVHSMRGWSVHNKHRIVQLHIVRVWHVQHHVRKNNGMLVPLQCRVLFQHGCLGLHCVPWWNVRGIHGVMFLHVLCLRYVQHHDWAPDRMHGVVFGWILLYRWCKGLHRMSSRKVLQQHRYLQLQLVRMWSLQPQHCPHGVHGEVRRRLLLRCGSDRMHGVPRWQVPRVDRAVRMLVMRVRSVPT